MYFDFIDFPFPQLHTFFFHNPLILISIAIDTGCELIHCTIFRLQGATPLEKTLSPSCHYLLIQRLGLVCCSRVTHEGWLTWHCAGTTASDLWAQRSCRIPKTLFQGSFPRPWLSRPLTPFLNPPFMPLNLGDNGCDIDVPVMPEHSTASYSLHLVSCHSLHQPATSAAQRCPSHASESCTGPWGRERSI